ncbi:MAG: TonB-dependent receptor [Gammaproteobacteria bacterium]|nr:MAG: TonB-dependent receptor [Gammaproteobacteria bacterium]
MMRKIRTILAIQLTAIGVSAGMLAPVPGWTQQLEEIVVTARKREENLQEVPISITAFTAEGMLERNIRNTYDIANITPNFSLGRNLGRRLDAPTIRGQFGALLNPTGPNASFFVDGVFVTGTSSNLTTNNLERVEVLRGPQAALFGRATFSGAVNYITRKPSNEFEGAINARAGDEQTYELTGWASGPIIRDKLLFTASAGYQSFGGEWRNNLKPGDVNASNDQQVSQDWFNGPGVWAPNVPLAGEPDCPPGYRTAAGNTRAGCPWQVADSTRLGGEETKDISGKLTWVVTDAFELSAKIDYIETDDGHFPALIVPTAGLNCFRPPDAVSGFEGDPEAGDFSPGWFCGKLGPANTIPSQLNLPDFKRGVTTKPPGSPTVSSQPAPFIGAQTDTTRYLLEGIYDINDWEIIGRVGYTDYATEYVRDLDRSYGLGPVATGLFEQYSKSDSTDKSCEMRVASPAANRLRGLAGIYYFKTDEVAFIRDFNGFGRVDFAQNRETEVVNHAVFGSLSYDVTELLTVSFDARYASDTPEAKSLQGVTASQTFYSFTPRLTIEYQARDNLNFYMLAAKGNKPGGYNTFAFFDSDVAPTDTLAGLGESCDLPGQEGICGAAVIEEEEQWTYEVGAKTMLFDDRLLLNAAVYYIDWTNQAVDITVGIPTGCQPDPNDPDRDCILEANNVVRNVGKSSVYGVELEATLQATDNLMLSLAYGSAKTELKEFFDPTLADLRCSALCWQNVDGVLTDAAKAERAVLGNVSGNEGPRNPEHSLSLGANFTRAINAELEWFTRTDLTWSAKQWSRVSNLTHTGESTIWNAWAGLGSATWTLSFYVDNILDDDTSVLNNDFPLFDFSETTKSAMVGPIEIPLATPSPYFDAVLPTGWLVTPRRGRNYGMTFEYRFGGAGN